MLLIADERMKLHNVTTSQEGRSGKGMTWCQGRRQKLSSATELELELRMHRRTHARQGCLKSPRGEQIRHRMH